MPRSNLTVKALTLGHSKSGYGKAGALNTIAINTNLTSATITAGAEAKIGDLLYVYPMLSSEAGAVATIGETLVLNVTYYKERFGLVTVKSTTTFTAIDDATDINTQLALDGLDSFVVADVVGTRLRIRALADEVGFNVDVTSTDLTALKLTAGDYGIARVFRIGADVELADTTMTISEFYSYGVENEDTNTLTGLSYEVIRFMGESTGATLGIDATTEEYRGSSLLVLQSEDSELASTLEVTELEFKPKNLSEVKGFKERTSKTFFSGQACDKEYNYGGYSTPSKFAFKGFAPKTDGIGLIYVYLPICRASQTTIPLGKAFRAGDDTFNVMAEVKNRSIGRIYEL